MERTVAAFDARRQFGRLLQAVTAKGNRYVVERHGEPVATVVPIEVYEQWKRARADLFARWQAAAEHSAMSPKKRMRWRERRSKQFAAARARYALWRERCVDSGHGDTHTVPH